MISSLRKWRSFPPHERTLCREALFAILRYRISLWIFPFPKIIARSEIDQQNGFATIPPASTPAEIGEFVTKIACRIPCASCLTRSLAVRLLLARRGFSSTLHFGAKRTGGKFAAHAWVEVNGKPVIDKGIPDEFSQFQNRHEQQRFFG